MLGAFILVSALLVGATIKARQNPLYQLSHFSRSPALKRYVSYVSTEFKPFANGESIIGIHEPTDGSFKEVLAYEINRDGSFNLTSITPDNKGTGIFEQFNLSPSQLVSVKQLISQLPPSAQPAKSEDVIVVLTDSSTSQPLRLYNRQNLPPQISEIMGILATAIKEDKGSLSSKSVENSTLGRSKLRPLNSQNAIN